MYISSSKSKFISLGLGSKMRTPQPPMKIAGCCVNKVKTLAERSFCSCHFKRFMHRFLSEKVKNVSYNLVCLSLFCISRGKKTKEILLVGGKRSFLYVDTLFDMAKCKFIVFLFFVLFFIYSWQGIYIMISISTYHDLILAFSQLLKS